MTDITWEYEFLGVIAFSRIIQELTPEQSGHDPYRKKKPLSARNPFISIR